MSEAKRQSYQMRELLRQPAPIVVPCAYDCVSARIVELAGFPAVMHGGFNTAASVLGIPDVGLITMTEMIAAARHMARSVRIPVLADVDDGFGEPLVVTRTTREAIISGCAGLYLEDQVSPKQCPALGGGRVVPVEKMNAKLEAVRMVANDLDPDFVVIARTHASLAVSLEEGLKRAEAYAQHGADLVWIDLGYDQKVLDDLHHIAEQLKGVVHLVANMTENVGRPMLTTDELYAMGFKMVTYPLTLVMTAAEAMTRAMHELATKGSTRDYAKNMMPVKQFEEIVRMGDIRSLQHALQEHQR